MVMVPQGIGFEFLEYILGWMQPRNSRGPHEGFITKARHEKNAQNSSLAF